MKVGCAGLRGDLLEEIDIDAIVLGDSHVPDVAGIWINSTEFDVTAGSIDDLKSVTPKDCDDLTA